MAWRIIRVQTVSLILFESMFFRHLLSGKVPREKETKYVRVCIYTHTHTHIYVYIHICILYDIHIRIYICYAYTHTHTHTHTCEVTGFYPCWSHCSRLYFPKMGIIIALVSDDFHKYCCSSKREDCLNLSVHMICLSEKALATHSSTLAWKIPWKEEPGGCSLWGR